MASRRKNRVSVGFSKNFNTSGDSSCSACFPAQANVLLSRVARNWIGPCYTIIQLSPEGEVNSGGYIPRREASRYISTALHRP